MKESILEKMEEAMRRPVPYEGLSVDHTKTDRPSHSSAKVRDKLVLLLNDQGYFEGRSDLERA